MGKNSTATKRIGFEGYEDGDWWGQRMLGSLEMEVQNREERSREIHR